MAVTTCEHYWYESQVCGRSKDRFERHKVNCPNEATGRIMWLGSTVYGWADREIDVCDSCRKSVEVQNMLEQATRDGTLHQLLEGE